MALAKPKKKKIIIILIIILSSVQSLLDQNVEGSPQEILSGLLGDAEQAMRDFPSNEGSWSSEQNAVWSVIETIHTGLQPEAMGDPDYEGWATSLDDALARL